MRTRRIEVAPIGLQWRAQTTDPAWPITAPGDSPSEAVLELAEKLLDIIADCPDHGGTMF